MTVKRMTAEKRKQLAELDAAIEVSDTTACHLYREARKHFRRAEQLTRKREALADRASGKRRELEA